jgi:hypothetical protein
MSSLDLSWDWATPPDEEDAFGPERSTWASLNIELGGTAITAHRPRGVAPGDPVVSAVVGAMSGLADWLVENWLPLLWELHTPFTKVTGDLVRVPTLKDVRDGNVDCVEYSQLAAWLHRHSFGHGSSDLALPSIVFLPEHRQVGVSARSPAYSLKPTTSFAVQWPKEPVWIPREELTSVLRSFVEATIERARSDSATRGWADWLASRFSDVVARAEDEDVRRELMFGSFVARQWGQLSKQFGPDTSVLAGLLSDAAIVDSDAALKTVANVVAVAKDRPRAQARWRNLRQEPGSSQLPPFKRGYRLAERVRQELGLPDRPLLDLPDVLGHFDVGVAKFRGADLFRSACTVASLGGATVHYAEDHDTHGGVAPTRFAIAASFGRLLAEASGQSGFGAAHGDQSPYQRTQEANAFAAEFLLPLAAMRKSTDLAVLCERYGISRRAAERHLSNRLP